MKNGARPSQRFGDGKRFNPDSFHPEKMIIVTMKA